MKTALSSLIFSLVWSSFSFAGTANIAISEIDGKVFSFSAGTNGAITWQRCKDFSAVEEEGKCVALNTIAMPENFFKAHYFFWIKNNARSSDTEFLSNGEMQILKSFLNDIPSGTKGDLLDFANLKMKEISKRVDYYKNNYPTSSQSVSALAEFSKWDGIKNVLVKSERYYDELLAKIKGSGWISKTAESNDVATLSLRALSEALDTKTVLPNVFEEQKNNAVQTTSSVPKSVFAYLESLEGIIPKYSSVQLAVQYDGSVCLLDVAREHKLQCYASNLTPFANMPSPDLLSGRNLKLLSGVTGSFFAVQNGDEFYMASKAVGANTYFSDFVATYNAIKPAFLTAQARNYGPVAVLRSGAIYPMMTTMSNFKTTAPVESNVDANATEFTTTYNTNADSGQTFLGCWISSGKVKCSLIGLDVRTYVQFPTSGEAAKALQLPGVNRLAMAFTSNYSYGGSPALCSSNGTQVACLGHTGSEFKFNLDARRGLFAYVGATWNSTDPDVVVCGWGEKTLRCYNQLGKSEVNLPGITNEVSVTAVAHSVYGLCAATPKAIYCSTSQNIFASQYPLAE